jgi:Protein kinase domain
MTAAIGAGGMGEVYRARDTKLDRDVAIKMLPAAFASDPERLARFEREARLLASLNHTSIAHLYGFETATLEDGQAVRCRKQRRPPSGSSCAGASSATPGSVCATSGTHGFSCPRAMRPAKAPGRRGPPGLVLRSGDGPCLGWPDSPSVP